MPDLLALVNLLVLGALVALAGRYLYLLQHGYCLSLYQPN